MEEFYEISRKENRQSQIEALDIGDTIAIARRVELQYGFAQNAITEHNKQVRGIADQQTHRARLRHKDRKFKVENGSYMTKDGALIITAAITRVD